MLRDFNALLNLRAPSFAIFIAIGFLFFASTARTAGTINIDREVILEPGQGGRPNAITRSPDGEYVIDNVGFVTKIDPKGGIIAEQLLTQSEDPKSYVDYH